MIEMSRTEPADRKNTSWSTPTSSTEQRHPRLSRFLERTGWFEIGFTVVALGIYDFIAYFLGGVGITEARCPGARCTPADSASKFIPLPTQIQILHDAYWVLPVLLALPLLVGLLLRRWLVLMVLVQVVVGLFLLFHIVGHAKLLDDRLHGRVPCWNPKHPPINCPWADHS
jgi:hypothetical protein